MGIGRKFADTINLIEVWEPESRAAATYNTGWWQVLTGVPITAVLMNGTIGTATLDGLLQQATDGSGTGAKTLKTMAQITSSDQVVVFTAELGDLDTANDFSWVRLQFTIGVAALDTAALLMRYWNRVPQMSELDAAAVAESL